ncbi:MAG: HAMP domain-containing histidine kinase [Bacteroidetes bacterium]|nr:HAMP domain-containing histidine kinase [Bacteroidota bacterium]
MKLLNRVTLYYLAISLLVFSFGGFFFYVVFKSEVYEELDEQIRDEKRNLERALSENDSLNMNFNGVNLFIEAIPVTDKFKLVRKDTLIHHPIEGELYFRQWRFPISNDQSIYSVTIRKALIDVEDLAEQIAFAMFYAFLAFIFIAILLNFILLKQIFNPFYVTLGKLKKYSLNALVPLEFSKSKTTEFNQLNSELKELSNRIISDYKNIKEFNQNASHEIQTPLAIIKNKLELLIQSTDLNEKDASLIISCYEASHRLSKLVQSLLLLTKIENHEFGTSEVVDLFSICKNLVEQMKEEFEMKEIKVIFEFEQNFKAVIHPFLAEILVRNLLSNALKYTNDGGVVKIISSKDDFAVFNTGSPFQFDPGMIFKRFFYAGNSSVSQGIGLSLVKKIAESFKLNVTYSYVDEFHKFTLKP